MTDEQSGPAAEKSLAEMIAETRAQVAGVSPLPSPSDDLVRGYRLVREIHRGGQGVVYLAHHAATHRDVALKVMRQGPLAGVGERARFEREIQILGSMKHPNIVAIHDSGCEHGNDFFVMDYIAGESFDGWADRVWSKRTGDRSAIAAGSKPQERIVQAFIKTVEAVAVAHQRGIIHRDIKPSNIRVDANDEPFVLDFGLAKALATGETDDGAHHLTLTGQFVGTLLWASPEQLAGTATAADTRGDVYALGLVLYRALAGRMPYPAQSGLTEMVRVIAESEPERLSQSAPGIDLDLETIVLKCLSKSPERRYPSAAELADDLRRFVDRQPIRARPDSAWYTLRMFVTRNKLAVAATGAFLALLLTSSVALALLYARANRRATETERVVEFQAAQLAEVDPAQMGEELRALVLAQMTPPAESGAASAHEQLLAQANFTNVARDLLDHSIFTRTLSAIDEQFADEPQLRAKMLHTVSRTMIVLGLYERAMMPAETAMKVRTATLGASHPDTLDSQVQFANLLLTVSQTDRAATLLHDALQHVQATGWSNAVAREVQESEILKSLGEVCFQRGDYEQAFRYISEATKTLEVLLGLAMPKRCRRWGCRPRPCRN